MPYLILLAAGWKHAIKVEGEELPLVVDVPAHYRGLWDTEGRQKNL